jgi:hypothetical protein
MFALIDLTKKFNFLFREEGRRYFRLDFNQGVSIIKMMWRQYFVHVSSLLSLTTSNQSTQGKKKKH